MYSISSNSASQAILDAEALTTSLPSHSTSINGLLDIPAVLMTCEAARLPSTAKIIMANRSNGPNHVMQVAEERAPNGSKHIHDIIGQEELEGIGRTYKAIAGLEIETFNKKAIEREEYSERMGRRSPKAWVTAFKRDVGTGVLVMFMW